MANSTRILIALVIGIGVGWLGALLLADKKQPDAPKVNADNPRKTKLTAGHHEVTVGPTASDLDDDPAQISIDKKHTVRWFPQDPESTLTITFDSVDFPHGTDGEPPFAGGPANQKQVLICTGEKNCYVSINPNLKKKLTEGKKRGQKFYYKYSQKLEKGTSVDEADGLIIIEP